MQKKIYVAGMFDDETSQKVDKAVNAVAGVQKCVANPSKAQVVVDYDETATGIEEAINAAISSTGVDVLG